MDADRQTHRDTVFSFILRHFSLSLRSKRFRSVSEQKETVEGDFWFSSFFTRSLTLVLRSLLLNRTEPLATQATVNLMRLRHHVHR